MFILMRRGPPRYTSTDKVVPDTTRFRSDRGRVDHPVGGRGPTPVGQVFTDEATVVVVALHRIARVVVLVEGLVEGVEGEGLPARTGRGVVTGIQDHRGTGPVADRTRNRIHPDVVVPEIGRAHV